jgi:hypothetical protein
MNAWMSQARELTELLKSRKPIPNEGAYSMERFAPKCHGLSLRPITFAAATLIAMARIVPRDGPGHHDDGDPAGSGPAGGAELC